MASKLADVIELELGATERWPDDVRLYQPYQAEQITFPDYAACLSVKTYLQMCGLTFTTEPKINAEAMSPSGRVPFIKIGPFLVAEMEPIIASVQLRGFNLSESLTDIQKSELRAYMSLIGNSLVNAEHYLAWLVEDVARQVSKPRYGAMYPWPLNQIIPFLKQREVRLRLHSLDWSEKTFEEVLDELNTCCQALSERLEKQQYFFGDKPTELDALVFGHLYTLLTTDLPIDNFAQTIRKYPNLVAFCDHVDKQFYQGGKNMY